MQTVKSFINSSVSIPIKEEAIIICPVDETGRNSVRPSTMPRIKALR
jgi:hypothetical protein